MNYWGMKRKSTRYKKFYCGEGIKTFTVKSQINASWLYENYFFLKKNFNIKEYGNLNKTSANIQLILIFLC